ncbi:DUF2971 domain-containing protein [Cupriavidus gilardii]|uniref:DUF2971 domain-containing protein n=1 Tax=Cupriavidus gilardii TaxID=82541 RepID=UPI001EE511F1|nr:DUF2971 domain-containing protein [Cupriavidus gilardii]MCG5259719.1 DUF2971 domain-containing protein [Cupriavidus gilardii]
MTDLGDNTLLTCFSSYEGPDEERHRLINQPTMWAHYADKHTGVCLIFEQQRFIDIAQLELERRGLPLYHGPVGYYPPDEVYNNVPLDISPLENMPVHINRVVSQIIQYNWQAMFLRKHEHWSSESEYRFITRTQDPTKLFLPISESLVAVVAGSSIKKEHYDAIRAICIDINVPMYMAACNGAHIGYAGDHREDVGNVVNVDHVTFSTRIPGGYVCTSARDGFGNPVLLTIHTNGDVRVSEMPPSPWENE